MSQGGSKLSFKLLSLISFNKSDFNVRYHKNSMQKDRCLFTSSSHDEMLVNLVARKVEVPPGNMTLFNPLKKAVESAL
jgi:hypothetical protein